MPDLVFNFHLGVASMSEPISFAMCKMFTQILNFVLSSKFFKVIWTHILSKCLPPPFQVTISSSHFPKSIISHNFLRNLYNALIVSSPSPGIEFIQCIWFKELQQTKRGFEARFKLSLKNFIIKFKTKETLYFSQEHPESSTNTRNPEKFQSSMLRQKSI